MSAIVHGWCGFVEKANEVVFQQMVINKLFIPDVLIDIIKDYLYVCTEDVLRKYYRRNLNLLIKDLVKSVGFLQDFYGRRRIAIWQTQSDNSLEIQLQGRICVECGSCCTHHATLTGCCPLEWDLEGEAEELFEEEEEEVPEVTWDISVPETNQQEDGFQDTIRDTLLNSHEDFDWESQMADYAEYQRELLEMEAYGRDR
jgi:hypothetical protein